MSDTSFPFHPSIQSTRYPGILWTRSDVARELDKSLATVRRYEDGIHVHAPLPKAFVTGQGANLFVPDAVMAWWERECDSRDAEDV